MDNAQSCDSCIYIQISHTDFYLWVLHPVAYLSNCLHMTPSIATKFQYINSLQSPFYSLHVSALTAILRRDILLLIWRTILLQRIRSTYTIWYKDVIAYSPNKRYQIKYKKNCKISKIPRY
jgi:hypothetical protein